MITFFSGKLNDEIANLSKGKMVELGHGVCIGHKDGIYDQYVKQLREQRTKGNGAIYLGKAIKIDKNTLSIQDPTDKFSTKDVPKLLIMFNTILNPIQNHLPMVIIMTGGTRIVFSLVQKNLTKGITILK